MRKPAPAPAPIAPSTTPSLTIIARLASLALAAGCSSSATATDARMPTGDGAIDASGTIDADVTDANPIDGPGQGRPVTGLGAHALSFYRLTDSNPDLGNLVTISTPGMRTTATGSTIIVSMGRGELDAFALPTAAPTDNQGNPPYPQIDVTRKYERWPSGTAIYALTSARGGANHTITAATPEGDEITLAAVEVLGRTKVQDYSWNQVLDPPHKSLSVTTTGAAMLVAFWWGDGFVQEGYTATANNGFTVIDAVLEGGSLVQCAVAVKTVTAAGTYDVTWTATPAQGAQLWLVAIE